jgi:thiamine biosynthesis protein ThiS
VDELAPTGTVTIQLNGKPRSITGGLTVRDLLTELELAEKMVVVELNGTILPRAEFATTGLSAGDVLEVVHFVGGG